MLEVVVIVVLILLNGFFSLSEIALISSKENRLLQMSKNGNKKAKTVLRLREDSSEFLSSIQVAITLIGIINGAVGGVSISGFIVPLFEGIDILSPYADKIALIVTITVITYVSIVIGELVPKTIALSNPEKLACSVAPYIKVVSMIFHPFVVILSTSTTFFDKLLGIKKNEEHITESELKQMIKTASTEGVIEKEQNVIHENVFYFSDKKAKHIMTHRTDVEWIDITQNIDVLQKKIRECHHSKLICSRGELNNFVGVLYLRDYFKEYYKTTTSASIKSLMQKPLIFPENTDAQKILNVFRQKSIHFCIVVNEYGGFEGIITLYDIMENILGEIPNEGERYEPDIFVREDNTILISGDAPIESLTNIIDDFDIDFDTIDYSTVAGFAMSNLEKMPQIGDVFTFKGNIFEIVDIDGNRIDKILIRKLEDVHDKEI